jgi:hypothetical protein
VYTWDKGVTYDDGPVSVCPLASTTYTLTATDSAGRSGEVATSAAMQAARSVVTVTPSCSDGGTPPVELDAGGCDSAPAGLAAMLPEVLSLDVAGPPKYFGGGADFPAGTYRLDYVDGCMKWGQTGFGWAVGEGLTVGVLVEECILVGATQANILGVLPGLDSSGVPSYGDCVAMSKAQPPLVVHYDGGKLGIFNNDTVQFDDVGGDAAGGVSPTWRLSLVSACP